MFPAKSMPRVGPSTRVKFQLAIRYNISSLNRFTSLHIDIAVARRPSPSHASNPGQWSWSISMLLIGSRMAVAAYATSSTLRIATSFSYFSSIPSHILRPSLCWPRASIAAALLHPILPSKLSMAASSTSSDHAEPDIDIASNISSVKQRISDAVSSNDRPEGCVRLVAVSKTKPLEFLQVAYQVRIDTQMFHRHRSI